MMAMGEDCFLHPPSHRDRGLCAEPMRSKWQGSGLCDVTNGGRDSTLASTVLGQRCQAAAAYLAITK